MKIPRTWWLQRRRESREYLKKFPGLTIQQQKEELARLQMEGEGGPPYSYAYLIICWHPTCLGKTRPQYYMGSRITNRFPWNDRFYWGSSDEVKAAMKRFGRGSRCFEKRILKIGRFEADARLFEHIFHKENTVAADPKFWNRQNLPRTRETMWGKEREEYERLKGPTRPRGTGAPIGHPTTALTRMKISLTWTAEDHPSQTPE